MDEQNKQGNAGSEGKPAGTTPSDRLALSEMRAFLLDEMQEEAQRDMAYVTDSRTFYEIKMKYLGRAGKVTALLKRLKEVVEEDRPVLGK